MTDQQNNESNEPQANAPADNTNPASGEPVGEPALDAASRSLTDALRVSFAILKVIMAVLIVLFLGSGLFTVGEDENALVLRFGRIRGTDRESRVLKPGFGWDFPSPISEVVRIPVTRRQTLEVDTFWYGMTEEEKIKGPYRSGGPTLNPERDGYCLIRNDQLAGGTGTDYNIVHCRLQVIYHIADIERFFKNVYYPAPGPGQEFLDVAGPYVDPLLKALTEDAVVQTLARYTIDEALTSVGDLGKQVQRRLEQKLDQVEAGIAVDRVNVEQIVWPRQVNAAFEASIQAPQTRRDLVVQAQIKAEQMLNEAGGPRAATVMEQLQRLEADREALKAQVRRGGAEAAGAREKLDQIDAERIRVLSQLSGRAGQMIAEAQAYRTQVVKTAQANARYLQSLLAELQGRPALAKVVLERIYQETIEEVLNQVDEKVFLPARGEEVRVLVNRDPMIPKEKERQQKPKRQGGVRRD